KTYPPDPLRSPIITETFPALSQIVPSLSGLNTEMLPDPMFKGDSIVSCVKTDIYDPATSLHRRFELCATTDGSFNAIDTGKLTMAPYLAEVCAERIC